MRLCRIYCVILRVEKNTMEMDKLPKDPAMLMSFLNMKLRDNYSSLDELCDDMGIDRKELLDRMNELGMEYLPEQNKFW